MCYIFVVLLAGRSR